MTTTNLQCTKWNAFKSAVQSTWLWRVYGVCAMKRPWSKLLIAVSLCSLLMVARVAPGLLTPILELAQMDREEGVLMSASYHPRTQDFILVRLNTGEERSYRGSLGGIDSYIGKPVTVWSQQVYEGWLP